MIEDYLNIINMVIQIKKNLPIMDEELEDRLEKIYQYYRGKLLEETNNSIPFEERGEKLKLKNT